MGYSRSPAAWSALAHTGSAPARREVVDDDHVKQDHHKRPPRSGRKIQTSSIASSRPGKPRSNRPVRLRPASATPTSTRMTPEDHRHPSPGRKIGDDRPGTSDDHDLVIQDRRQPVEEVQRSDDQHHHPAKSTQTVDLARPWSCRECAIDDPFVRGSESAQARSFAFACSNSASERSPLGPSGR